jgi:hypothetical protein
MTWWKFWNWGKKDKRIQIPPSREPLRERFTTDTPASTYSVPLHDPQTCRVCNAESNKKTYGYSPVILPTDTGSSTTPVFVPSSREFDSVSLSPPDWSTPNVGKAVQGASDALDETLNRASDAMDGNKWSGGGSGDYGSNSGGSSGGGGSFDSGDSGSSGGGGC